MKELVKALEQPDILVSADIKKSPFASEIWLFEVGIGVRPNFTELRFRFCSSACYLSCCSRGLTAVMKGAFPHIKYKTTFIAAALSLFAVS